ncbi:hypothetical protein NKG94_25640 [Micromonospora sp. M12]
MDDHPEAPTICYGRGSSPHRFPPGGPFSHRGGGPRLAAYGGCRRGDRGGRMTTVDDRTPTVADVSDRPGSRSRTRRSAPRSCSSPPATTASRWRRCATTSPRPGCTIC